MLTTVDTMQEWNYSMSFHQQLKDYLLPNSLLMWIFDTTTLHYII
jgi:hypothetical protein